MCWSSATLFYSTFVKAIPLSIAADAWTRLKPSFIALDIISARRSKGTLRFEEGTGDRVSVGKLPLEVLELVKRELVELEMESGLEVVKEQWTCSHQPDEPDETLCDFPYSFSDPNCECDFLNSGGMLQMSQNFASPIRALLADFKLSLPSVHLISPEQNMQGDLTCLVPFALPLLSSNSVAFPGAHARRSDYSDYEDSHAIARVDPSSLVLPVDAERRFKRFLAFFSFASFDPSSSVIRPHPPSATRCTPIQPWSEDSIREDTPAQTIGEAGDMLKKNDTVLLSWQVWSFCPSCQD